MHPEIRKQLVFTKEFTKQEPIPEEGIERAVEILRSGRLHRYNTAKGEVSETALLEKEVAEYFGKKYCAALSSCGSALYVALLSCGVRPGDKVLCNAFTLAPVPGAIANAGAQIVLVEINEDYKLDTDDLARKAETSGAKYLMLSHMRGHISDMDRVVQICKQFQIKIIEDCAHTLGAKWSGKYSGTFGLVGCFSTQTYKHMNSGEGGLLITDDEDVAAQAILYSGSYMLYKTHLARPSLDVFERYKKVIPNFSLRMSNLQAAVLRPQLRLLEHNCRRWTERYRVLERGLSGLAHLYIPRRPAQEEHVASSFQFTLKGMSREQAENFIALCAERGVEIKWFGWKEPKGFTSRFESWQYITPQPPLPNTKKILDFLCDFRIPLTFSLEDCETLAAVIRECLAEIAG